MRIRDLASLDGKTLHDWLAEADEPLEALRLDGVTLTPAQFAAYRAIDAATAQTAYLDSPRRAD